MRVTWINRRKSTQNLVVPSDFFTRTMGDAHSVSSPLQGTMTPAFIISSMHWSATPAANSGRRRGCCLIGVASPVSMRWSTMFVYPSSPCNEKASRYLLRTLINLFLGQGYPQLYSERGASELREILSGIQHSVVQLLRQLLTQLVSQQWLTENLSQVLNLDTSG